MHYCGLLPKLISITRLMSRFEPGLLDKLFGGGPHEPVSAVVRQLSLDELKGTVARHIESLLNARITFTDEHLAGFNECQRSLLMEWTPPPGTASMCQSGSVKPPLNQRERPS